MTFDHVHHYDDLSPTEGRVVKALFSIRWTHFSLEEAMDLPEIGPRLRKVAQAVAYAELQPEWPAVSGWYPAVYAARFGESDSEEGVHEAGLGGAYLLGHQRIVGSYFAVALRSVTAADQPDPETTLRINIGDGSIERHIDEGPLPPDEVCLDFLQMQRNAMWNTGGEPA